VPAAEGRAGQLDALPAVDPLEPVQRQVIRPAAHDRVGQQPRAGKAALDRELGHFGDLDRGPGQAFAVLADEFGPHDPQVHQRGLSSLERVADLFADALEGVEALAVDLVGDDLDHDLRQMLRQRLAAGGLRARRLGGLRGWRCRGPLFRGVFPLEQCPQDREGELGVVAGEPLGLLPRQESPLEALAQLEQLQVELAIALALGGELLVLLLELAVARREEPDVFAKGGGLFCDVHARE